MEDPLLDSTLQPSFTYTFSRLFHIPPQQGQRRKSQTLVEFTAFFMRVIAGQNADNFNCLENIINHTFCGQLHSAAQVHVENQESMFQSRSDANVIPGLPLSV